MEKHNIIEHVWEFKYGGMEKNELDFMYDLSKDKVILELGTEVGQNAYVMASVANKVVCVDAWDDAYEHLNNDPIQKSLYLSNQILYQNEEINKYDIFGQFKRNCKKFIDSGKLKYIKGKTLDVVDQFEDESFDIILIDADHSYEGVLNDIYHYLPKVKKDGLLVFHDYGCGMWTGVTQAAEQAENKGLIEFDSQFERIAIFKIK
jgi:SAM-dependent methyltransferase